MGLISYLLFSDLCQVPYLIKKYKFVNFPANVALWEICEKFQCIHKSEQKDCDDHLTKLESREWVTNWSLVSVAHSWWWELLPRPHLTHLKRDQLHPSQPQRPHLHTSGSWEGGLGPGEHDCPSLARGFKPPPPPLGPLIWVYPLPLFSGTRLYMWFGD